MDFKNYALTASLKDQPKLERSIALFNGLSQWVQCMVLCKTLPQQRADVIVKFINVAKVCYEAVILRIYDYCAHMLCMVLISQSPFIGYLFAAKYSSISLRFVVLHCLVSALNTCMISYAHPLKLSFRCIVSTF